MNTLTISNQLGAAQGPSFEEQLEKARQAQSAGPIGQIVGYAGYGVNPARLRALELAVSLHISGMMGISITETASIFLAFLNGDIPTQGISSNSVAEAGENPAVEQEAEAEPITPPLDTQEGEAEQVSEAA